MGLSAEERRLLRGWARRRKTARVLALWWRACWRGRRQLSAVTPGFSSRAAAGLGRGRRPVALLEPCDRVECLVDQLGEFRGAVVFCPDEDGGGGRGQA